MNATLRSQAKYRGVAVKFLLEVEVAFVWRRPPLHLLAPPPIALLGRREVVPGWSRAYQLLRKNVYIASPLITSNRPLFSLGVQDFSGGGRFAEQVELAEAAVVFRRRGKRSQ